MNGPRIDLHLHSTASDGSYPPETVVVMAEARGVMALTDHDTLAGIPAAQARRPSGHPADPGVELAMRRARRPPSSRTASIRRTQLRLIARFREGRRERAVKILARLKGLGIRVSMETVEEISAAPRSDARTWRRRSSGTATSRPSTRRFSAIWAISPGPRPQAGREAEEA
jgi:predicted metal-dependent phosphoesterase TrpH